MFWERFYNLCVSKGTKPNPVAKEIGVSSGIVTKWKTTGTLPNGETLIKIADYLDCSVDYLLGRTDDPGYKKVTASSEDDTVEYAIPKDIPALTPEELKELKDFLRQRRS